MARRNRIIVSSWRRPKTSIYNDNYLFGFNFYDDMMTWLNKRETGVPRAELGGLPRLLTVPETAFRKFQRPPSRNDKLFEAEQTASAVRRTQDRIENLVWRKEKDPRRRGRSADRELSSQLSGGSSQEDLFSYGGQRVSMRERRSRIEEQQQQLESRMATTGLRFSTEVQETTTTSSSNVGTSSSASARLGSRHQSYLNQMSKNELVDQSTAATQSDLRCKQLQSQVTDLEARLEEAETRVRTEVMRVKRSYEDQVAELETRLETAHRTNLDLQKTIQKQAMYQER